MQEAISDIAAKLIRKTAIPLTGAPTDFDGLLALVGDAPFVLLGEASHGTHEFYRVRAEITKRLIREKGFSAVAVEADWPDAYRVNRYVSGRGEDADAAKALSGFLRFPSWMWRNADVLDFVGWLRSYNDSFEDDKKKVGFFGLDLYSLHSSIAAVLEYLDRVDPQAATRARARYACFANFGEDPQAYGYAAGFDLSSSCESEVIAQLVDLRQQAMSYAQRDGWGAIESFFSAEQNARLVKNAEHYYRTMFRGRASSWNLRDAHMVETFDSLVRYLDLRRPPAKIVVWAHNSHIGDARATQMQRTGEWNIGQLIREKYPHACRLIGFSTYTGTVTAASNWDGDAERKQVRPARKDSFEGLFHQTGIPAFFLSLADHTPVVNALREPLLERAIGVIYLPQSELSSHYFEARIAEQFDAILHYDTTRAVEPLEPIAQFADKEPAETFPSGM
jgi:erythromycin esterase-like protein